MFMGLLRNLKMAAQELEGKVPPSQYLLKGYKFDLEMSQKG
jgi:hypothetical protein